MNPDVNTKININLPPNMKPSVSPEKILALIEIGRRRIWRPTQYIEGSVSSSQSNIIYTANQITYVHFYLVEVNLPNSDVILTNDKNDTKQGLRIHLLNNIPFEGELVILAGERLVINNLMGVGAMSIVNYQFRITNLEEVIK
jgi:hypothetical protein